MKKQIIAVSLLSIILLAGLSLAIAKKSNPEKWGLYELHPVSAHQLDYGLVRFAEMTNITSASLVGWYPYPYAMTGSPQDIVLHAEGEGQFGHIEIDGKIGAWGSWIVSSEYDYVINGVIPVLIIEAYGFNEQFEDVPVSLYEDNENNKIKIIITDKYSGMTVLEFQKD